MAELLFYTKPEILNRENHKDLNFLAVTDLSFSRDVNSVPVLGIEFFEASRDMPILFSRDESGAYFPIALLSLRNEGHDQLNDSGQWKGNYTPAFIRRYPFALTDDKNICFDQDYAGFNVDDGEPLFDEEGANTKTLDNIIEFVTNFDVEHQRSREFCDALTEQELLTPFRLQIMTADKQPLRMDGLFVIDEKKLESLTDDVVSDWFKEGFIAWAYAHLHSLGALRQLGEQLDTR
ncbi:SapC family protein [Neptunomonas qingdaonensis]|uniref:SapC protein n=1 Tax=Neptunomonas qingdaonensis TaxID=1045558 RepID=A0A1I2V8J7_9GAMM|nr:SapC family protein [Neptunomonas qingdaonensis]SFG85648.1 SapC protein [Neptunomonas qingdaonensis]